MQSDIGPPKREQGVVVMKAQELRKAIHLHTCVSSALVIAFESTYHNYHTYVELSSYLHHGLTILIRGIDPMHRYGGSLGVRIKC